ncbi:MAG: TSUP family transporter [Breznakibacter sp.]
MDFLTFFGDYSLLNMLVLTVMAFTAGFIDSVVGGGGLVQVPALLINLPNSPLPMVFGTNKIAALSGTMVAAWQYSRKIRYNYLLLVVVSLFAFAASRVGAKMLYYVDASTLKPVILVILILIALFTFARKDLGSLQAQRQSFSRQLVFGSLMAIVVGIYDGFFGPGTGSFFVLGFVTLLGFDFLTATAYTKIVNCVTNLSALIVFFVHGDYILELAILMAISNVTGSLIGSRMALKKGNAFIRMFFLAVVSIMIVKYGWDVFVG